MNCSGQVVIQILRSLEDGGVPAWLDGGWGVDALLKKETRAHQDVDLIISLENLEKSEALLREAGFIRNERRTDLPTRLVLRNSDDVQIDIHPVTFRPDGSAVHIDGKARGGAKYPYVYSSAGLSGTGMIGGRVVRCTTAAEQIRQKVERHFSPWAASRMRESGLSADLEDILSLLEVFGTDANGIARATEPRKASSAENPVVEAANQFCLRHVSELNAQHSRLVSQCTDLIADRARLQSEFIAIHASTSWRLTAPMRSISQWLKTQGRTLEGLALRFSGGRKRDERFSSPRRLGTTISEPSSSAARTMFMAGRDGA